MTYPKLSAATTTQTTQLTNNVISQCTFLNDKNLTCSTVISYQGNLLWATQTTSTNEVQKLSESVSSGNVVLKAGCKITELLTGNSVIVTFAGEIIDGGSVNTITGTQIGIFTQST